MRLAALGAPVLRKMDDGKWNCSFRFPSPEGVTAEVRSDFNHRSPQEALQKCIDRLGGLQNMVNVASSVAGLRQLEVVA